MNQASLSQEDTRRPMGTLACLTAGFEIAARHIELILLPLVLDLFLWLGPRLSVGPILQRFKSSLMGSVGTEAMSTDTAMLYAWMGGAIDELSEAFNLFSVLNPGPLSGVPALMPSRLGALRPFGVQPAVELTSQTLAVVLMACLALLGLGLNAVYLRGVGRRVLEETESPLPGPGSTLGVWRRLATLGLLYVGVMLALSMALSFVITLTALISARIAGVVMMMAVFSGVSAAMHLMFTIPGVVQLRRDVISAMRESLLLTRADFLNVIFLLGLVFVVSQGLNVVWMLPALDSWATVVGLAGHAFVSTALTVAVFVFYQERLRFLEVLKQLYKTRTETRPVPGK